jgi:predicted patatin/cPLA2 family phospholipase
MKTGLVLEGGALRTIFSSGVCDGFLEGKFMPDYVVGVSAGIAYGVSYISRQKGRNLEILLRYANDKRYMGKRNLLKRGNYCYFGLDFTYETIPEELMPFDYKTFAAYPGGVEAVVTNLETGGAEYFPVPPGRDEKKLLQATCAMPLLFPIYHIDGVPCLDGGAADAIPYRRAFERGCDRLIVILTRERSYLRRPERLQPLIDLRYRRYPQFCETMRRRAENYNACRQELFELEREGKVLLFAPEDTQGFSRIERDVEKIRTLWQAGYDQALSRIEEVKRFASGSN